jgi:hypothetical protein
MHWEISYYLHKAERVTFTNKRNLILQIKNSVTVARLCQCQLWMAMMQYLWICGHFVTPAGESCITKMHINIFLQIHGSLIFPDTRGLWIMVFLPDCLPCLFNSPSYLPFFPQGRGTAAHKRIFYGTFAAASLMSSDVLSCCYVNFGESKEKISCACDVRTVEEWSFVTWPLYSPQPL